MSVTIRCRRQHGSIRLELAQERRWHGQWCRRRYGLVRLQRQRRTSPPASGTSTLPQRETSPNGHRRGMVADIPTLICHRMATPVSGGWRLIPSNPIKIAALPSLTTRQPPPRTPPFSPAVRAMWPSPWASDTHSASNSVGASRPCSTASDGESARTAPQRRQPHPNLNTPRGKVSISFHRRD